MNHRNDEDRLDEMITRAADIGSVEFDRAIWLGRIAAKPHRKIWRRIMESKVTRYSAAATILVVASLVLSNPFSLFGSRHGVVLAEAARKVSEMGTSVGTCSRTVWYQGQEDLGLSIQDA